MYNLESLAVFIYRVGVLLALLMVMFWLKTAVVNLIEIKLYTNAIKTHIDVAYTATDCDSPEWTD